MALWDDLITEIYSLTARPDLTAETQIALRNSVRAAHKSGKYWRDLTTVTVGSDATPLVTTNSIQTIDLPTYCPNFRQLAYLKSGTQDKQYRGIMIDDLIDPDNFYRTDVYYGFGQTIKLRAAYPENSYELAYYQYPVVSPTSSFASWIADQHRDLLTLWAACTVLAIVGETDIKTRLESSAAIEFANLQQDNLGVLGN